MSASELPPEGVLQAAIAEGVNPAIIVGFDLDGKLFVSTSSGDHHLVIGLLTRAMVHVSTLAADAEDA